MLTQDQFVKIVENYLRRSGMTATAFGVAAVRDPGFVFGLRRGRSPSLKMVSRVQAYIEDTPAARTRHGKTGAAA